MQKISILKAAMVAVALLPGVGCYALDGSWRGELDLKTARLPLVFNFSKTAEGETRCTLDSPLQGVKDMPADVMFCSEDSVSVALKSIGASFSGKVSSADIKGVFSQRGYTFPMILTPEESLDQRRPQTPKAPFPYTTVDTTFKADDGMLLAGTITIPEKPSKGAPVVVMVTGSGPQNRDEELFDHRPFAVIADYLARNGVASFRYDDRGTAQSQGDFKTADIDTFKSDAEAAVNFIRKYKRFGKVGMLGHSEGGTIALMLASEQVPDFVVSMAGAIVRGKDLILEQNRRTLKQLNLDETQIEDALKLISLIFDDIIAGKEYAEIPVDEYVSVNGLSINPIVLASLKQNMAASSGDYFRKLLSMDPSEWIGKIEVPVLAVNGTLDTQVNSEANLGVVRNKLPKAEVKEYPGLNHLLQQATTGDMSEYINIRETISTEVLEDITGFILTTSK